MIDIYVNEIRCALKNKCYFSALSLALTLPDFCGMAEFPDKQVSDRYIGWYDKYVGESIFQDSIDKESPYLSGEMVYNLRNTYLHQGSPNVVGSKVKKENNQIDKFILVLGDGTIIQEITISIGVGNAFFRGIIVDVTYLCNCICDCALYYYENNREKFVFDFNVILQDKLYASDRPSKDIVISKDGGIVGKVISQKLESSGIRLDMECFTEVVKKITKECIENCVAEYGKILSDQPFTTSNIQTQPDEKDSVAVTNKKRRVPKPKKKKDTNAEKQKEKLTKNKKELQLRSFFGQNFKEKKYKDKKEDIINAVLSSNTKTQLNGKLTKMFPDKDVKMILKTLKPFIKDMPGN